MSARATLLTALVTAAVAGLGITGWRWSHPGPALPAKSRSAPPADLMAIKSLAIDHRNRGDLEGFVRVLDRVPDDSPDKPRALLEQAVAYRQMGDGLEFERTIAACLEREPDPQVPSQATLGAWGILVDHYLIQQRWDEARDVFWKLFDAAPDPPRKKYVLLRLLAADDDRYDPAQVIAWHEQFLARNPYDADARRALGLNLVRIGRLDEARVHLEACAATYPETPRFVESWLWFLLLAEDLRGAGQVVESLPPGFQQVDAIWVHRGRLHELRGEWTEAADCFRRALALAPHRLDANNRLLQALRAAGMRSEAAGQARITKQIAEAKRTLLDTRERLLRERITPDSDTCATLGDLCRVLGWTREAQAWRTLE